MKYLNVATSTATFFRAQAEHLDKLKTFLLTLIEYDGVTKSKLEELEGTGTVNLSENEDYIITALLTSHRCDRHRSYTIIFRDKDKAIEVGIMFSIEESKIILFVANMVRFKYGKSGTVLTISDKTEQDVTIEAVKDALVKSINEFISSAK